MLLIAVAGIGSFPRSSLQGKVTSQYPPKRAAEWKHCQVAAGAVSRPGQGFTRGLQGLQG
eukprot:1138748-Pelagomonas_calceolata.AAC.4